MRQGAQNETFIMDNLNQNVEQAEISDHTYSLYENEGGRTWLSDTDMRKMDTIKIINKAHVAIQPNLTRYFTILCFSLQTLVFPIISHLVAFFKVFMPPIYRCRGI